MIPWDRVTLALCLSVATATRAAEPVPLPDRTCFQGGEAYSEVLDIGTDMAIVYGMGSDFAQRLSTWVQRGYTPAMMTGISWGDYHDYFGTGDNFKKEEVQTRKDGSLRLHNPDVGYNVPTPAYIEYMKKRIEPAVDAGVQAIFLEEPEFWADTGWSEAFKKAWQDFYHEPWQPPDSSVDAQYRASKLKYELNFIALRDVFAYADERARWHGRSLDCVVPTHSLLNYAHWGIVSPESYLIDIPQLDGYVAQVWTGTARTPTTYAGVKKERTFESGFLEYGQMLSIVQPTRRKVWFLHDPIEDNPNYSWNNYKTNYECTVVASLMWPEVHHFEVMPWPIRIFQGAYPKVDLDTKSGEREGIPADYATQILTVINALNDMHQEDVEYDTGTRGIGVLVSDTLMFQRAAPARSDRDLGHFYGLALPLLKVGVPVMPVQLENVVQPNALSAFQVLLLTYEGQKPLRPQYHEALADWVRGGGCLIFVEDGSDPYHAVREWWNEQGTTKAKAYDDLFHRLGVEVLEEGSPHPVDAGFVTVILRNPSELQKSAEGAERIRNAVAQALKAKGVSMHTTNYLKVRRGPYVIAAGLDESVSDAPLTLHGAFVDLFDSRLPVSLERRVAPNDRVLLCDLNYLKQKGVECRVVAAACRIRHESVDAGRFIFHARGPLGTTARARVLLPKEPVQVLTEPPIEIIQQWDSESSTLWLEFANQAKEVAFTVDY